MNIVNIANIVDFNAMRYKKQCNDLPQVLVSRQTGNSIERDNFSAMYLCNGDSLNSEFVYISLALKNKENDT